MKAAVISHGEIKNYEFINQVIKQCDIVVCADGGAEYAVKCGVIPHILVGDLDSIDEETLNGLKNTKCRIIRYPREKDYTDTQLAVNYAIESGADEIYLLGCIGDRMDHSLANIFMLVKLLRQGIKGVIVNEKNSIYITDRRMELKGTAGDIVSLIPIGGDVTGINTEGLQYKLTGGSILLGDPLGISNVFIKDKAEITIDKGILLVIKSRD